MRSLLTRLLAPALLLPLVSGCIAHLNRESTPAPGYEFVPPTTANPTFTYEARGGIELSEPVGHTRFHEILNLSFPSSGHTGAPDNKVHAIYYKSLLPGPKKLVIVLPIWGTSEYPPSRITRGYARHSHGEADLIWILGDTPLFPWTGLSSTTSEAEFVRMAKDSAERYRTAVVDLRRLLDWAETQPNIDASRIGMVGFSMSALVTATLLGNDSRISAAVLMMGAANFANIFSHCDNRAGEVRRHVLTEYGWSLERYHDFFEGLFGPADPVLYEGHYNPERILMIDAMFDDCMSRSSRDALWEATGHPERVTLMSRHRSGFYSLTPLGLNFIRRRIYRFLDDTL
ncbi:MAG TPA: hypothetical protein VFV10_04610 [Gammaproteobacteria bacterium]|nr:hypothetical protein [Gammaproteobacteria bacterium]